MIIHKGKRVLKGYEVNYEDLRQSENDIQLGTD